MANRDASRTGLSGGPKLDLAERVAQASAAKDDLEQSVTVFGLFIFFAIHEAALAGEFGGDLCDELGGW